MLLYLVLPSLLMGPSTAVMGYSFSLLQKGIQKDPTASGYRVGVFQAGNILGCTIGSLLCGLWLLDDFGTSNTLRAMMFIGVIMAAIGMISTTSRIRFTTMMIIILMLIAFIPTNSALWVRLHGQSGSSEIRIAEDMTGISALTPKANSQNWWIWANGKTQSLLPYGGFHTKLGVLPVTLVPDAGSVAIIGLGSGDTAWAAACRTTTKQMPFDITALLPATSTPLNFFSSVGES
ncbi:MAG: hypothetical protein JNL58_14065 [Planctomyces sp.]|nr:hypothetical protein [Planctomyces sp.]